MRLGVTFPLAGVPLLDQGARLRSLADFGFTDAWSRETHGFDAFTPLAAAAVWAPPLRLGTAIANVFTRGPALLAMEAAALAELAPGRFVLGLGVGSEAVASGWNGLPYEAPVARVRDTLRFLRRALAGERVDEVFEQLACRGFALECPPREPPPIFLAALRPRMLSLAAEEADGVLLALLTPDDVRHVCRESRAGEATERVLRVGVVATSDREAARDFIRRRLAPYLDVPAYAALHRGLGRGEALAPLWRARREGDREGARAAVPDELVDGLFVHGTPERCAEQLEAFFEAGITTLIVSPMGPGGDPLAALETLGRRLAR